jgi:hypothetical protein
MIKLFRRIRQKLLAEGEFRKYVPYALGEIVLVVIGILIAVQVNTCNQNRLDNREEDQLLQAIQLKMKFNRFQTETGTQRYEDVMAAATALIKIGTGESPVAAPEEVDYHFHQLPKRFLVGSSNQTSIYDEMIGAGQLNLLSSDELRRALTSLKANLELLASYENLQTRFVDTQLSPYLNQHLDRLSITVNGFQRDTSQYDQWLGSIYQTFTLKEGSPIHSDILNDPVCINLLSELIYHTETLLPIYLRIEEDITAIERLASRKD